MANVMQYFIPLHPILYFLFRTLPNASYSMRSIFCGCWELRLFPALFEIQELFSLLVSGGSFHGFKQFSLMHMQISTQQKLGTSPSPPPSQPRSLEHALRRNHISGIISYEFQLVGLFLSNADLCFLNLVRSPESAVKSPFLLSGEKFLLSIYLSNHRAHPVYLFFKMIILCCLLYSVIFNIFFCFLSCLCQVVKCYLNISFIA